VKAPRRLLLIALAALKRQRRGRRHRGNPIGAVRTGALADHAPYDLHGASDFGARGIATALVDKRGSSPLYAEPASIFVQRPTPASRWSSRNRVIYRAGRNLKRFYTSTYGEYRRNRFRKVDSRSKSKSHTALESCLRIRTRILLLIPPRHKTPSYLRSWFSSSIEIG